MSRGPSRFKQSDVARAIRAARKEGAGDVIIDRDGNIRIVSESSAIAKRPRETEDEIMDRELAELEASLG